MSTSDRSQWLSLTGFTAEDAGVFPRVSFFFRLAFDFRLPISAMYALPSSASRLPSDFLSHVFHPTSRVSFPSRRTAYYSSIFLRPFFRSSYPLRLPPHASRLLAFHSAFRIPHSALVSPPPEFSSLVLRPTSYVPFPSRLPLSFSAPPRLAGLS